MIELRPCTADEVAAALRPIAVAFGNAEASAESVEEFGPLMEPQRMHAAFEDGAVVGHTGAFSYELTVPGGSAPAAGVTVVAVLPTHRRRGLLRQLMRAQLDDVRARGEPVAILWASEEHIYGRFGYGMASLQMGIAVEAARAGFRDPSRVDASVRLVGEEEALEVVPPIYDAVRAETPGMVSRSDDWWRLRRLSESSYRPEGFGSLFRAVLRIDGEDAGFALYRVKVDWSTGSVRGELEVAEAMATSLVATRELWRYLFSVDLISMVRAGRLPLDHPLVLLVAEPRRLQMKVGDALWCRLVDVGAALSSRGYAEDGALVLEVSDEFCPWNEGRWRLEGGRAERTDDEPELRLDVADLGSVYLGGFTWSQLARAGLAEELAPGAVARADAIFRSDRAPWCPEIF